MNTKVLEDPDFTDDIWVIDQTQQHVTAKTEDNRKLIKAVKIKYILIHVTKHTDCKVESFRLETL